jgi:hypothetical protein
MTTSLVCKASIARATSRPADPTFARPLPSCARSSSPLNRRMLISAPTFGSTSCTTRNCGRSARGRVPRTRRTGTPLKGNQSTSILSARGGRAVLHRDPTGTTHELRFHARDGTSVCAARAGKRYSRAVPLMKGPRASCIVATAGFLSCSAEPFSLPSN